MAGYPPLLVLPSEADYRTHFEASYCRMTVFTFDGLMVRFRKDDFDHCFFESTQRNRIKDRFSTLRAERMDWIKAALADPNADRFIGWDRDTRQYRKDRRVTLVCGDYVVVISLIDAQRARFITAYVADTPNSLQKLKAAPRWTP
jgi:hypothetical protein